MMADFEQYLQQRGYRNNTIEGYLYDAKRLIKWMEQEGIDAVQASYNDLLKYTSFLQGSGIKKVTITGYLSSVRLWYECLMDSGVRADNPGHGILIKNITRHVPHDLLDSPQLDELYQCYPAHGIAGRRNKCMLGLLVYQGLTTAELSMLEVKDVQLEAGKIYIPSTNRSNSRTLKLQAEQVLKLQDYLLKVRPALTAISNKESERLFISEGKSKKMSNSYARMLRYIRQVNPAVKDLKQVRATVITLWLKQYNVRQVQYMSGHRYVSSTQHYQTNKLETLAEQLEKLHPLQ